MKKIIILITLLLILSFCLFLCGCKSESTPAQELTKSVAANAAQALPVTAEFKSEHLTDAATLLKGIFFEVGRKINEDVFFNFQCLTRCCKLVEIHRSVYRYFVRLILCCCIFDD